MVVREFFKLEWNKALLFFVILLLASSPFVGTTARTNELACPSGVESYCDLNIVPYDSFYTRPIFWWPWGLFSSDLYGWVKGDFEFSRYLSTQQNPPSPLLNGIKRVWVQDYNYSRDIVGISLSLVYFYVLACSGVELFNKQSKNRPL